MLLNARWEEGPRQPLEFRITKTKNGERLHHSRQGREPLLGAGRRMSPFPRRAKVRSWRGFTECRPCEQPGADCGSALEWNIQRKPRPSRPED
jgi:hypothetical protein